MRRAGRKFLEFMTQKDAFLRPFPPFFMYFSTSKFVGGLCRGAGGVGRPPAKNFGVYDPKRCIFKDFITE